MHRIERPLRDELYQSNRTDSSLIPAPLILASGSPRRVSLLDELCVPVQTIASDVPEITGSCLDPEAQALARAQRKAQAVASRLEAGTVLGADTIVVLDGDIVGKSLYDAHATCMLRRLGCREHRVVTGIAVPDPPTGSLRAPAVATLVRLRALSVEEIAAYVASGEQRGKAGAYAIHGLGAAFVSALEGCFTNVVGLPLCETVRLLSRAGVIVRSTWQGCRLPDCTPCPSSV